MTQAIPCPAPGERPTTYADRLGRWFCNRRPEAKRKQQGQYLTPVPVADFMAGLCGARRGEIGLLDPGAGTGVLSCALVEHLVSGRRSLIRMRLEVYETDPLLCDVLERTLRHLREFVSVRGHHLGYAVRPEDFVLANAETLRDGPRLLENPEPRFDVVIANPPYFKIPRSDPRATAAAAVVHGQPNIYALFMGISAALLAPNGELVFITPRSYASGHYFRSFRRSFFTKMRPEVIHVFDSRTDAFNRDGILQESVILKGRRAPGWADALPTPPVVISSSRGSADLGRTRSRTVPGELVIDLGTHEKMLRMPLSAKDERVIRLVHSWRLKLDDLGLEISTGPVVAFRARAHLSATGRVPNHGAPMLWLNNVSPFAVRWPLPRNGKEQYLRLSAGSAKLLVPDRNYVLLRRFSAKEDNRRLVAAPHIAGSLGSPWLGLENHLNYIYRPGGSLTEDEAWGLAVLFNSELLDRYFRILNGNTQVSAAEIRYIPMPELELIRELGQAARRSPKVRDDREAILRVLLRDALMEKQGAPS